MLQSTGAQSAGYHLETEQQQGSRRPCGFHLDLVGTQLQSNDRALVGAGLSAEPRCRLVEKNLGRYYQKPLHLGVAIT